MTFTENNDETTHVLIDSEKRMDLEDAFQDMEVDPLNDHPISLAIHDSFKLNLLGEGGEILVSMQVCNRDQAFINLRGQIISIGPYNKFLIRSVRGFGIIRSIRENTVRVKVVE